MIDFSNPFTTYSRGGTDEYGWVDQFTGAAASAEAAQSNSIELLELQQQFNASEAVKDWQRSEVSAQNAYNREIDYLDNYYSRLMNSAQKAGVNALNLGLSNPSSGGGQQASSSAASSGGGYAGRVSNNGFSSVIGSVASSAAKAALLAI